MQFGIRAANYPFIADDMDSDAAHIVKTATTQTVRPDN